MYSGPCHYNATIFSASILHATLHRYVHACMSQLSHFFRLWPPSLQLELCRVLFTEEFVRLEKVLSRGNSPTKVFFIVSGKVGKI